MNLRCWTWSRWSLVIQYFPGDAFCKHLVVSWCVSASSSLLHGFQQLRHLVKGSWFRKMCDLEAGNSISKTFWFKDHLCVLL